MTASLWRRYISTLSVRPRGFTLVELLVVISIVALLVAIILPVLSSAREASRSTVCLSQLRQIGIGTETYLNDYAGYYPAPYFEYWYYLGEYIQCDYPSGEMLDPTGILTCPADDDPLLYDDNPSPSNLKNEVFISYGVNYRNFSSQPDPMAGGFYIGRYSQSINVPNPSDIPIAADANDNLISLFSSPNLDPVARHTENVNLLFADSSARGGYSYEDVTNPGWNNSDIPAFWR